MTMEPLFNILYTTITDVYETCIINSCISGNCLCGDGTRIVISQWESETQCCALIRRGGRSIAYITKESRLYELLPWNTYGEADLSNGFRVLDATNHTFDEILDACMGRGMKKSVTITMNLLSLSHNRQSTTV